MFILCVAVMPYNSAHHCVVEVENFLLLLGGEDQWNPNGKTSINVYEKLNKTIMCSISVITDIDFIIQ